MTILNSHREDNMKKNNTKVNTNTTGLSTKNYKPSANASKQSGENVPYRYKDKRKPISKAALISIVSVTVVLIAAIAVGVILLVLDNLEKNERIDYLRDDISKYVTVDPQIYKGYTVTVNIPEITETEVDNKIIQLLAEHKGDILYDGDYYSGEVLAAGDTVWVWQRGYEYDDDGNKIFISGTSNLYGSSPKEIQLGSGGAVVGFELALIGKNATPSGFPKKTYGEILDGDIVYITTTCVQEVGDVYYDSNVRIDLSDPEAVEAVWGEGFIDYLRGIGIGNKSTEVVELKTKAGDTVLFTETEVSFTTTQQVEESAITFKVVFPHDYAAENLRNKEIYFDVFIEKSLHYDAAEYNDELIKKIGYDEEKLSEFEGESLADKFRARIRRQLENERSSEIKEIVIKSIQSNIYEKAEFKKLPQGDVQDAFDFMYYQLELEYLSELDSMGSLFDEAVGTIDDYLISRFGLSSDSSWEEYLYDVVETDIKERLAYMQVLKQENLMPTEEEYLCEYRATVEADYELKYKKTRADFANDELYEEALSLFEAQMINGNGGTYFDDMLYYNISIESLVDMVTLVNLATDN